MLEYFYSKIAQTVFICPSYSVASYLEVYNYNLIVLYLMKALQELKRYDKIIIIKFKVRRYGKLGRINEVRAIFWIGVSFVAMSGLLAAVLTVGVSLKYLNLKELEYFSKLWQCSISKDFNNYKFGPATEHIACYFEEVHTKLLSHYLPDIPIICKIYIAENGTQAQFLISLG